MATVEAVARAVCGAPTGCMGGSNWASCGGGLRAAGPNGAPVSRPEPGYWLDAALVLVGLMAGLGWLFLLAIWRQP